MYNPHSLKQCVQMSEGLTAYRYLVRRIHLSLTHTRTTAPSYHAKLSLRVAVGVILTVYDKRLPPRSAERLRGYYPCIEMLSFRRPTRMPGLKPFSVVGAYAPNR